MKIDTENPRLTFAQIRLTVDTVKEILAKAIDYADGVEFADVEGNAAMAVARTAGIYRADECTLEVFLDEYKQILDAFGDEFFTKPFEVNVAYDYSGLNSEYKISNDVLMGCRFTKRASSNQAGPDALTRTLSFKPMWIKSDGHLPLPAAMMPTGAK